LKIYDLAGDAKIIFIGKSHKPNAIGTIAGNFILLIPTIFDLRYGSWLKMK